MINVTDYIKLVENYDWSNPEIEYILIVVKLERRSSVMIANAIRKEKYKVELWQDEQFHKIKVHRKL